MAKKDSDIKLSARCDIIAFEDLDFLKTEELRSVRLQLEYLKPDLIMDQFKVQSTFVIFGSARTKSLEDAQALLKEAQAACDKKATAKNRKALADAKRVLEDSHYYQVARELAAMVTKESQRMDKTDRTYVVITGGGAGIMEAGNRGATEAGGITAALKLKERKGWTYRQTAAYGHFGRDGFPWEVTDKVDALLAAAQKFAD